MGNKNVCKLHILLLMSQSLCVYPGLICPDVSYLGRPAQLICTGGAIDHRFYNTSGVEVARCGLDVDASCQPTNTSAYRISSNQTALIITNVQISDSGTWACKNAPNSMTSCNLTIAEPKETGTSVSTSIIGGVSGASVFLITVFIIVFVVKRLKVTRSEETHFYDDLVVTVSQDKLRTAAECPSSDETAQQAQSYVGFGSGGSASGNDPVNTVITENTESRNSIAMTGTSTESCEMGADDLCLEKRTANAYLDTDAIKPTNLYEEPRTDDDISNI